MPWLNVYGLLMIAVIMVPNILFAMKCKDGFENHFTNRWVEVLEQIGRFGCFGFMIFTIPGTAPGWVSPSAFMAYLAVDGLLIAAYCVIWAVGKGRRFRALALSILPSLLFLFSGVMTRAPLLVLSALLFAPCHIWISITNAKENRR